MRLSSPIHEMRPHYTFVVIGSGYGGSIAASRLARIGTDVSVCLLERGREFESGDFPDTALEAGKQMQVQAPGLGLASEDLAALYEFRMDDDIGVFQGCGLGGTSLVNANVSVEPEPRVFEREAWPQALRGGDVLQPYFERARQMLKPTPYPEEFPALPKLAAQQKSAAGMGLPFNKLDINVNFDPAATNHVGMSQQVCKLCGDCVTGCNHQAKNTTAQTYLPDAWNHGAEIFCQVKVRRLERGPGHWIVHFELLDAGREYFDAPPAFVRADHVILAAGSLGSTEILLRSRAHGLPLADRLGHGFTGNGDVLGFGYNVDQEIRGIGFGGADPSTREPVGPCITSAIDARLRPVLEEGMIIEEGVIPGALAALVPATLATLAKTIGKDTDPGFMDAVAEFFRKLWSIFGGARVGATANLQTYLVMTHDDAGGVLRLEDDKLRIHWPDVGRQEIFKQVAQRLEAATAQLGGTFIPNPAWTELFDRRLMTVHPLGGCAMADSASEGVVDADGRVFAGTEGSAVHEGLLVLDGAIVPCSLGTNPLLTISALAERGVERLVASGGWNFAPGASSKPQRSEPERRPGIQFTEKMTGSLRLTAGGETPFAFTLTILSDDLEEMLGNEEHRASMFGTVESEGLSVHPLTSSHGSFQLFVKDPDVVGQRLMRYEMQLHDRAGGSWLFRGHKRIKDDPGFDLWADTTTLFIEVHRGVDGQGGKVGVGELRIELVDFARQLRTIQARNARSFAAAADAVSRFGAFFAGSLFQGYGGPFARRSLFDPDAPPRQRRELQVAVPEFHEVQTADGTDIMLSRYRGGDKGPVILSHGLGVASTIFSLDTVDQNLVEFLCAHGYDVWLLDYRSSILLPAAQTRHSADDVAQQDYPSAVQKVREVTGADQVQMVVHCFGATTFVMSVLGGHLQHVRSAVCSQMGAHVVAPLLTRIKTGLHTASVLDLLGFDTLTAYTDAHADWPNRLFNDMVAWQPLQGEERCKNPVCHRITFLYGLLYEHDQLNRATHDTLHETFGVGNIAAFEHLSLMTRQKRIVAADGSDAYLPYLERLDFPLRFLHGAENSCFLPASTEQTYQALCAANGPERYSRQLIENYGHIDCIMGKNAAIDVFPHILEHLENT